MNGGGDGHLHLVPTGQLHHAAGGGHALDDRRQDTRVEPARRHVVHEEERPRALDQNVVDTHGHKVDTDGVVSTHYLRYLELGTHPVRACHQHRIAEIFPKEGKQESGILVVLHDVSREKVVEKLKTEFVSLAAHQLRTPLTVLRGYLHLWESEKFEKLPLEKRKRIREYIIDSAERLHNIIKDVLQVVDLEGGKMTVKYELIDIKKLIKKIYEIVKPIYQKKEISFKIESSLKKKLIKTDPRFLEIALENILDNAAKYTPEKGKVKVSLLSQKNRFIIKVKDNGIGFSDEDKRILFEKFARGKRAWTLNPNGSGLGLYIVKKVIENLDGEIKIESQGINKGTEVKIILPLQ